MESAIVLLIVISIVLIIYFVISYGFYKVFKKLNYKKSKLAFVPLISEYLVFKLIYDGLSYRKIKNGKSLAYKNKRDKIALLLTVIYVFYYLITSYYGGDFSLVPKEPTEFQAKVSLFITLFDLFITYLILLSLTILLGKKKVGKETSFTQHCINALGLLFVSIITFGIGFIMLVYSYGKDEPNEEIIYKD